MKNIKFAVLTISLCAICLAITPYAVVFGALSSLFAFLKCREIHIFFHHLTQDILALAMESFDYADSVMGFKKHPGFGTDQDKLSYSVAYFAADWRHLHSTVVKSHCVKCAEIDGYHSDAADYASVTVERAI